MQTVTVKSPRRCACEGSNLDRFVQPVILSLLAGEPLTGYQITRRMAEYSMFAAEAPDPTGVYRYLKRMRALGLLEQTALADKEVFAITEAGRACLGHWQETLISYGQAVLRLAEEIGEAMRPR